MRINLTQVGDHIIIMRTRSVSIDDINERRTERDTQEAKKEKQEGWSNTA